MSLSEVRRKLYQKKEEAGLSAHEASEYDIKAAKDTGLVDENPGDAWKAKETMFGQEEKKISKKGLLAGGIILGIILIITVGFVIFNSLYSAKRVTVSVSGDDKVKSGTLHVYEISYENDNYVGIKGAQLRISYPEDIRPESNPDFKSTENTVGTFDIGDVAAHGSGKVDFNARVYNPSGALVYLKAELVYQPFAMAGRTVSANQLGINVTVSPIALELAAPQQVASGDEINYQINYQNTSSESYNAVRVKLEYPDGFTFSGSDPKVFEGGNVWYLGQLAPGQSGKIVASGKLEGNQGDAKNVKAIVGTVESDSFVSYNEESVATKIVSSPFTISQTVNGLPHPDIDAGQTLSFDVRYTNTGSVGLRDAIVKVYLDSPVLDYSRLELNGKGAYDDTKKTITWKASDFPELANVAPNQSGRIGFNIKVKSVIPMAGANDKNYVVSSIAHIDSPDVPTPIGSNKVIAGNRMDLRLNSKLVLDAKAFYGDATIPNSGPIPPQVGRDTTYTIHLIASNISNDIEGAKVEAVLPTNATITGSFSPGDANFKYNDRTNAVTWDIGSLPAGTGTLTPAKEIAFQVRIHPSLDQVGKNVPLLDTATFTAKDIFTGNDLSVSVYQKTTNIIEDASIPTSGYRVVN